MAVLRVGFAAAHTRRVRAQRQDCVEREGVRFKGLRNVSRARESTCGRKQVLWTRRRDDSACAKVNAVATDFVPDAQDDDSENVKFPEPLTGRERVARAATFWSRVVPIFVSYKMFEFRLSLNKHDKGSEDELWNEQHEWAAEKLEAIINDLKGFYVKSGQMMSTRPDSFAEPYIRRLSSLQDMLDPMPINLVKAVIEQELLAGAPLSEVFEWIDEEPLGAASVAQVHKARLNGGRVVAVKVQRPGIEPKLLGDCANIRAAAKKFAGEFPVDYYAIFSELESQLKYEFDFIHEASCMDRIAAAMTTTPEGLPRKAPVRIPRSVPGLVCKRVLVMDYIEGETLTSIARKTSSEGINPSGPERQLFARKLLSNLTEAFGIMIFEGGLFHGDPHPGNIMVTPEGEIVLLDFGQVKQLPGRLQKHMADLMLLVAGRKGALPDEEESRSIMQSMYSIGVELLPGANSDAAVATALWLFDSSDQELPGGFEPDELSENSPAKMVQAFPQDLVLVGRASVLIRGISSRLEAPWSLCRQWAPYAAAMIARKEKDLQAKPEENSAWPTLADVGSRFGIALATLKDFMLGAVLRVMLPLIPSKVKDQMMRASIAVVAKYVLWKEKRIESKAPTFTAVATV